MRRTPAARVAVLCLLALSLTFTQKSAQAADHPTVFKFVGADKKRVKGKEVLVVGIAPVTGRGGTAMLWAKNKDNKDTFEPDAKLLDAVKGVKPGDLVKVEVEPAEQDVIKSFAPYTIKPHEKVPYGYVFKNSYRNRDSGGREFTAVVLERMDLDITAAVPMVKDADGAMVPDEKMLKLLDELKAGEPVEAEMSGRGKTMTLTTLLRYQEPTPATFEKLAEAETADGQKVAAVEMKVGDKPVTAILPGKLQGKKWTPDPKVHNPLKKLKPGATLQVRTTEDAGKTYLVRANVLDPKGQKPATPTGPTEPGKPTATEPAKEGDKPKEGEKPKDGEKSKDGEKPVADAEKK